VSPSIASLETLDLPPFKPRFPWWGADLQTIAIRLAPTLKTNLAPHCSERMYFPLSEGSGDTLLGMIDRPAEPAIGKPLVILIHGLTGCEDSAYILNTARHLLDRGHTVLRLNLRGAGPSRPFCREHYFVGRTADFRRVLALLPAELTSNGIMAVGYSLGGAMLLKYLGEEGSFSPLRAAASVCAPIDLSRTCQHMMRPRNRFYHSYILNGVKREALAEGADLTARERAAVAAVQSVWEYDELFISPRYGFNGAEDYYDLCKPLNFMPEIRVPTLVLAAGDDPWIPAEYYRDFDWATNPALMPLLPDGGGHLGFHGSDPQPWNDLAVGRFFERACAV
jgi:uncharacterized protein